MLSSYLKSSCFLTIHHLVLLSFNHSFNNLKVSIILFRYHLLFIGHHEDAFPCLRKPNDERFLVRSHSLFLDNLVSLWVIFALKAVRSINRNSRNISNHIGVKDSAVHRYLGRVGESQSTCTWPNRAKWSWTIPTNYRQLFVFKPCLIIPVLALQ